ncbi:MAG: tRNA (guanosine(46)-N7)-methyltransferase TrmB [Paramuribaculum sp.]|nr:tRNA (guanosine(46)-N7)-methyltransferase TrmB [Paramuribaculum sp.]
MGKNKLRKFDEMTRMDCVMQYPWAVLQSHGFPLRGHWHSEYFKNSNPIIVELGCGKGEYTVALAKANPDSNFIGIDIKGARMWSGAKEAQTLGLTNVAFLRTDIELLTSFFAPGELAEIWITFPDPQMKKVRKRLTSTRFLALYRDVLNPGGLVNLKTDSPFLYTYTDLMARHNRLHITDQSANIDATHPGHPVLSIRTHYEKQWLARGLSSKFISMEAHSGAEQLEEPDEEIPYDTYRSYSRGYIQMPDLMAASEEQNPHKPTDQ